MVRGPWRSVVARFAAYIVVLGMLMALSLLTAAQSASAETYEQAVKGAAGVSHFWPMGEASGSSFADAVGSADAEVAGGVTLGGPGGLVGDSSTAALFGGSGSAQAGVDLSGSGKLTVEFWMKWKAFANDDGLAMEFTPNFNEHAGGFLVDPNASVGTFGVGVGEYGARNNVFFARPSAEAWHYYAFVIDTEGSGATEITPYVDGHVVSYTKTESGTGGGFADSTLYWMSRDASSLFGSGSMQDLALYEGTLSATAILEHYEIGRAVPKRRSRPRPCRRARGCRCGWMRRGPHIWITETGVEQQSGKHETALAGVHCKYPLKGQCKLQELAAKDFLQLGDISGRHSLGHIERVYYSLYRGPTFNTKHLFDSALLEGDGSEPENWRPAYCVLAFASHHCSAGSKTQAAISSTIAPSATTVSATIDPRGSATNYWIEWGTSTEYGQATTATAVANETGEQSETVALSGLEPCTVYHYQAEAENSANEGTPSLGGDQTFQTGGVSLRRSPRAMAETHALCSLSAALIVGAVTKKEDWGMVRPRLARYLYG
jgi:hypothetical protein